MKNKLRNSKVFVFAELSANHGGEIEIAKETIREPLNEPVQMLLNYKTLTTDTMTLDSSKYDLGAPFDYRTL